MSNNMFPKLNYLPMERPRRAVFALKKQAEPTVINNLPPEGPIWNLVFWIVIGLLVFIAADSVLYGLAPKNHLNVPGLLN
jgi:hypothetical protein